MLKFASIATALIAALVLLFVLAGRPLAELSGLARAGADVAMDEAVKRVPEEVRDRQLDHDLELRRRQAIDHQVQLQLSRRQIEALEAEVALLDERSERRRRLLAEAHPVLAEAASSGRARVQFAGAEHALEQFQTDLDALLAEDEREQRQLEIKRTGLERLRQSHRDGEGAMAEMQTALATAAQEIELLRARRSQAQLEAKTLDLVSQVTYAAPAAVGTGAAAQRLRQEVSTLEASNEARRATLPAQPSSNTLARDWERLERLAAIRESRATQAADGAAQGAAPGAPEAQHFDR